MACRGPTGPFADDLLNTRYGPTTLFFQDPKAAASGAFHLFEGVAMHAQFQDDHEGQGNVAREGTMSVDDYALSLLIALQIGARFGHCYENIYPAFFAVPQLFEPHGLFVEGWIAFETWDKVVLFEHGWLMSGSRIIDPTIVLAVEPGSPVYYYPGVLRARAELEALENEFFPHVCCSDYGDDGMAHPAYRAAYEAAQQKARALLTEGKSFVEVRAKVLTAEEEEAAAREAPQWRIVLLSADGERDAHG
jgi:hypothetical protein